VHGITFAFDAAEIRPESAAVLEELFRGLQSATSASIVIEGHTSSEGTDAYNQDLSERRAQAVVADLVRRGLAKNRLSAIGLGERQPIATNNDESGRSLNRRVEVKCKYANDVRRSAAQGRSTRSFESSMISSTSTGPP
jgi:outer membrane protein OmpA-like peptidoglycan-associated protein